MQNNVKRIRLGKSGADVFELEGSQILKHVVRDKIENGMFDTYVREAMFYSSECPKAYLPEVHKVEILPNEITIVMNRYNSIDRSRFNDEMLRKIACVLAEIHASPVPEFLTEDDKKADVLTDDEISECVKGWKSVLDDHPGKFDASHIEAISRSINDIIKWQDSEKKLLSHGDFHLDNILTDEKGEPVVCDWQGVSVRGASEDLSFFMSRLGADGIHADSKKFLTWYVSEYNRLTGEKIDPHEPERHIKAANVITSFRYWHMYLHGNDTERVREIYDKMISDYQDIE